MDQVPDIPADVRRFIEAHVQSVEQLEILRVLGESPDQEWSAKALARATQMQPESLVGQLAVLASACLVSINNGNGEALCRLDPRPAGIALALGKLLQVYNERPVTLINFLTRRSRDSTLNGD